VDVDQDGVLDIVAGIALGKDVTTMVTESDMAEFCRNNGKHMMNIFQYSSLQNFLNGHF
jgi:hypothetical protein